MPVQDRCVWVSGVAANAGPWTARLDFERSRDCVAKKPVWSSSHSRSYGESEDQVQACMDQPVPS